MRCLPPTVCPAVVAVVVAALVVVAPAAAGTHAKTPVTTYVLTASLSAAPEVPAPKGPVAKARGTFTARLTLAGKKGTLAWQLAFSGLTGPATAAHIHLGPPGKAGPIAIPLCGPCRTNSHGVFKGAIGGRKALLEALLHGGAYVNVHTKRNAPGEIRGQLGNWLSYATATRTATLTLVSAYDTSNNGFNFDGYSKGALKVSVPEGWKVVVDCSNHAPLNHSCAIVRNATASAPAFPGAAIKDPQKGLAQGKQQTFRFKASRTGSYRIACLVPGHEPAGMWETLRVTAKGLPTLVFGTTPTTANATSSTGSSSSSQGGYGSSG